MSDAQMQKFDDRLRRIDSQRRSLSRGFVLSVGQDGLIVARPTRDGIRFPWRSLLVILMAVMAFKVVLFAMIGESAYDQRIARLEAGTSVERAGAYVMRADPVTVWLSDFVVSLTTSN